MKDTLRKRFCAALAAVLVLGSLAQAAIIIETVPVGNPGNTGELSGASADPSKYNYGPDRICGAVNYAYNIGKYEVTAGQYTAFLNAVAGVDTYALYNTEMGRVSTGGDWSSGITQSGGGTVGDPYTYTVASGHVNRPVNYVSFGDAMRFANWLHNGQPTGAQDASTTEDGAYFVNGKTIVADLVAVSRKSSWKWAVTSEDEWYKAAYYNPASGTYYIYPTRNNSQPGRNLNDTSGNNANYNPWPWQKPIQDPYCTTIVGEFEKSKSPYGTFDQGGNVAEWNESVLVRAYDGMSHFMMRGGSWIYDFNWMKPGFRNDYSPDGGDYSIGFRVVSPVPEPASLALLALGVTGILIRRRGARR